MGPPRRIARLSAILRRGPGPGGGVRHGARIFNTINALSAPLSALPFAEDNAGPVLCTLFSALRCDAGTRPGLPLSHPNLSLRSSTMDRLPAVLEVPNR